MIEANYHTHTPRCKHAVGSEREYIETAIATGLKTLGFSDHVPQPFPAPYASRIRMSMDELEGYIDTLQALRKEYRDRIRILIGFEVEYFPRYFDRLLRILGDYPVDYIILGQHHVPDETDGFYSGVRTEDPRMKTGRFSYLAHPDLISFAYEKHPEIYREQMTRLCEAAKECGLPLEVNYYGYTTRRNYPSDAFFSLASSLGCRFIIGCDAHQPWLLRQPEEIIGMPEFLQRNGIQYSQELTLIKPC